MKQYLIYSLLIFLIGSTCTYAQKNNTRILSYEVNPKSQELHFFSKNEQGEHYGSLEALKNAMDEKRCSLIFAMNGGMYLKDRSPQGLFIEKGKIQKVMDTLKKGYGNFYLQPNGIFYLTKDNDPVICPTMSYKQNTSINYATQSGPMLIIDGKLHPKFTKGSANVHIRNGVGILPNGNVLFAMSKELINFYDFAQFFKQKGCTNALYLDGFVSRTYLPSESWEQLDGNFGVIIGVVENDH